MSRWPRFPTFMHKSRPLAEQKNWRIFISIRLRGKCLIVCSFHLVYAPLMSFAEEVSDDGMPFCSKGSEAMETAMELSFQYLLKLEPLQTEKSVFILRGRNYDRAALGALAVSGHRARRANYEPLMLHQIRPVSDSMGLCNECMYTKIMVTSTSWARSRAAMVDAAQRMLGQRRASYLSYKRQANA